MVRSVRIGISGFVVALIVSGVWFVVTNQAEKISQQAWHAVYEYVASQRAVTRGGSVEAMKRLANEACYPKTIQSHPQPSGLSYWLGNPNLEITPEDCVAEYMYGGIVDPMPSIFIEQWVWALAPLIGYCAFAGLALTAASEIVPLGFKVWWNWLTK